MHERGAIIVHFPLQDGEIRFDTCCVRKDGRQPAVERAQMLESTQHTVPRVIERGHVIVLVDNATQDNVGGVQLQKLAMLDLNLLDAYLEPGRGDVLPERVEHFLQEDAMT